MRDANLTDAARRVGYAILDHVNRTSGDAWPGYDRLATVTGLFRAAVGRGVELLLDESYLDHIRGGGNQSSEYPVERMGLSNRYRTKFDKCPKIAARSGPPKSEQSDARAASGAYQLARRDEDAEILLKLLGIEGFRMSQEEAAPAVTGPADVDDDVF